MAGSCSRLVLVAAAVLLGSAALGQQQTGSAVELLQDMYNVCLQDLSVSCVKPKALGWMSNVVDQPVIKITEDLVIVKSAPQDYVEEQRSASEDIFDKFEDFLETHRLVAKVPSAFRNGGELSDLVPRSFETEDVDVPLATGRSRLVKKVLVPFLLGLKFKTAVLVPLALALIALKTWKALTLGLLSLVLTGALVIFKISKPKITTYEVVHYPQHVEHHVEHPVAPTGWEHQGPYHQQRRSAQEQAYNAYVN